MVGCTRHGAGAVRHPSSSNSATRRSRSPYLAAALPREGRSYPEVAQRLGVEQLTIDTSHCPFLSRPKALAELLADATTTKPVGPLDPN